MICPALGFCAPNKSRKSDVLPAPLEPVRKTEVPFSSVIDTSRRPYVPPA
jgi:hypothetical protein